MIQAAMLDFATRLRSEGYRVLGVAELPPLDHSVSTKSVLRDVESKAEYVIFQNLGPSAQSCSLDPTGLVAAAGALELLVDGSCDLLVINKFGKEEAAGRGFCDLFRAAMLHDVAVLTSVNPALDAAWAEFAGGMSVRLGPEAEHLSNWWRRVDRARALAE